MTPSDPEISPDDHSEDAPVERTGGAAGRLSKSASPYLLQHADNPVDWYSWGDEAFERARRTDRPMFISIGYATCHWCHVMERESFENDTIADVLNTSFVAVKVDREEHPDVDHFYMTACTAGGRRGGWPLTILALPDGRPFYAATYLPPFSAGGRAGLLDILQRINQMWKSDRPSIEEAARDVTGLVERLERLPDDASTSWSAAGVNEVVRKTLSQIRSEYDAGQSGFGRAPKFPVFHRLRFLLSHSDEEGRDMALRTLRAMRAGGIWDHVGHGFHRYSTDRHWHLPHFEKMLYDQAMALAACAEAYSVSGEALFRTTALQLHEMLDRDFRMDDELLASAWDADSEGEEGKFYVWSRDELEEILQSDANDEAGAYGQSAGNTGATLQWIEGVFAVRPEGNFTDEATGQAADTNILDAGYQTADPDLEKIIDRFEPIRQVLLDRRAERVAPLRDEKCLSDWNGLFAAAAAMAGRLIDAPDLIASAERTLSGLLHEMWSPNGVLHHRKFHDNVGIDAGIDDYAMVALGCFELFQATGRPKWLESTDSMVDAMLERFFDEETGVLRISRRNDIPVSQTRLQDEAYPSGSGVALDVLSRLIAILDRPHFEACLERVLETGFARIEEWPTGHLTALDAAVRFSGRRGEIVVFGPEGHPLHEIVRRSYTPSHVHVHVTPDNMQVLIDLMPFLESLMKPSSEAVAFICTNRACDLPLTDEAELRREMERISSEQ